MNGTNQIPLLELKLPETGNTVMLAKWLTTGQSRELQKILLSEGKYNTEAGKIENVQPATFLAMQDKAAEFLIKEIRQGDDVPVSEFTQEWLYNLPVIDGNLVYEKINEITGSSTLSAEAKKK